MGEGKQRERSLGLGAAGLSWWQRGTQTPLWEEVEGLACRLTGPGSRPLTSRSFMLTEDARPSPLM